MCKKQNKVLKAGERLRGECVVVVIFTLARCTSNHQVIFLIRRRQLDEFYFPFQLIQDS